MSDGFPLGVEAAREGSILLTTDPNNSNERTGFHIDEFFIINRNDIDGITRKILALLDMELRKEKSSYIQDKMFELFCYRNQMEEGVFSIIDRTLATRR